MRKFLGIAAVALIVGAPALAQNASTMTYTLQLGGQNSTTPGARYETSTAVEVGPYVMAQDVDVISWSARLNVGGTIDGLMPGGAANIVFDLALKDSNGALVGPSFGIGSDSTAGFFSNVMNQAGGGPFAQQPAAFPWVYDTWYDPDLSAEADTNPAPPYGRVIDPVSANGPNMAQFTYPSTYQYYRPAGAAAANTTTVTAASGTLMGMGAGYTDFYFTLDAPERGGVGLTADNGQQCYGCQPGFWCMDIGTRPVVEGQINMKGLLPGTYTLQLTAGTGNNVLLPTIACSPYNGGTAGAFAAAANTVTGSTITFVYNPTTKPAPVLQPGVASVKLHGGVAYGIPFIGETVSANPGGATSVSVECRNGGVTQVYLPFDVNVGAVDGSIDAGSEVVVTGGTITSIDAVSVPKALIVNMTTTNVNGSCVTVTLTNICAAGGGTPMAATTKAIKVLRGDVTGDGNVLSGDVSQVKAASGVALNSTAVAFRRDFNVDGNVLSGDVTVVKGLSGNSAPTCP